MGINPVLVEQNHETSKLEETRLLQTIECLTLYKNTKITIPGIEEIEIKDYKLLKEENIKIKTHVKKKKLFQLVKTLVENTL